MTVSYILLFGTKIYTGNMFTCGLFIVFLPVYIWPVFTYPVATPYPYANGTLLSDTKIYTGNSFLPATYLSFSYLCSFHLFLPIYYQLFFTHSLMTVTWKSVIRFCFGCECHLSSTCVSLWRAGGQVCRTCVQVSSARQLSVPCFVSN